MQWPRWSEIVLGIVAIAAALLVGVGVGRAGGGSSAGRLRVSASGQSLVAPDEAQVILGANVTAPTAAGALGQLAVISQRMVAAMRRLGVPAKDVQTSNLSLGQNYGNNGVRQGYQANETFTLTIFKLPLVSQVITGATATGANQLNGVNFLERDPNTGIKSAVAQALGAARRQAEAEAKQLGVTLGPVVSVQVNQNSGTPPIYFAAAGAAVRAPAPSLAVSPGNQAVTAQVSVVYSFH